MIRILNYLRFLFSYYVIHNASLIDYLRHQGLKIGTSCELLNCVNDYGSEPWLIQIGNRVTITSGVVLVTHDGSSRLFRKTLAGSSPYGNRFGKINILDNCFIGVNSILMPDVTIGPNSIIGAGSVVINDVPPNTVVAGVPAHEVTSLNGYIEKYKEKMVPIKASTRKDLRRELTRYFWGEER